MKTYIYELERLKEIQLSIIEWPSINLNAVLLGKAREKLISPPIQAYHTSTRRGPVSRVVCGGREMQRRRPNRTVIINKHFQY